MTRRTSGFTLVELMVSLVVGGVVVAAGHAILSATVDSASRARAAREPAMAAATARLTLTEWVRSAVADSLAPFRVVHRAGVGVHADELDFSVSHGGDLYPGPHRIRLWVYRSGVTPPRGLVAAIRPAAGGPADTLELVPDALGLEARVLVLSGGREQWVTEWTSMVGPPLAIELRLEGSSRVTLGAAPERPGLPAVLAMPIAARVTAEAW